MVLLDDNTGYPDETHETFRISKSRRFLKKGAEMRAWHCLNHPLTTEKIHEMGG